LEKAKLVVEGFMKRYVPKAWAEGDVQTLARVHKGGPRGHKKEGTLAYGRRVEAIVYEHNKQTASVLWGKAGVR
jgi:uracil DNA glycosylase